MMDEADAAAIAAIAAMDGGGINFGKNNGGSRVSLSSNNFSQVS